MAQLYEFLKPKSKYYDKNNFSTQQQYDQAVRVSSTVYVGNLPYQASQDSIKQLFIRAGKVKKIIMGINDVGQRCGFCFVIYETHQEAERAVQYISQTKLNSKTIRVDVDPGYKQGRQKGRGRDGNQKRDDFRPRNEHDRSRNKYNDRNRSDRYEKYGGDRGDRGGDRGDRGGDRRERYDRGERGDRNYGRERYQRDRDYNREPQPEEQPRNEDRQEQQQKSEEQY